MFLYSSVEASKVMTEVKEVWIAIHKKSQTEDQILCAWCSCVASAHETCNHVIACFYNTDYGNTKGFCNPSCTEQACTLNQCTKTEIVPKRMVDLFVRKRLASSENKNV